MKSGILRLLKVGPKTPKCKHPDKGGKRKALEGLTRLKRVHRIILSDLELRSSPKRPTQ